MSNLRQAAQQALEALEERYVGALRDRAIEALEAALAEPEQEPVAWEQFYPDIGKPQTTHWEGCEAVHPECRATPRKPLTPIVHRSMLTSSEEKAYAAGWKAAERAHGIGGDA